MSKKPIPTLLPLSTTSRPDRKPIEQPSRLPPTSPSPLAGTSTHKPPMPDNVKSKSIFQSFLSLKPNAKIGFGIVLGVIGIAGMLVDQTILQEPTKKQDEKPLINVRMVDRPAK
ncbi:uncharacterized protein L203_102134 [Cryptococcus depauperatus CBS 7841]|uniref:Uncharacterized protein n=1 Tax=Cryptococcus depauperatus CBS 7841 TaxID=1295531 RepID=A0A1E3IRV9_9TREE|nr:hypothetical protein L203_01388 [Cryptococcus depauperatus CBS 7841]